MEKKLLIKQVIGRMLLDSSVLHTPFTLRETPRGWQVTVQQVAPAIGAEICQLRTDLNLFYFEQDGDGTLRKWWLYDLVEPDVTWNETSGELTLIVNSRVAYTNENV